MKNCAFTIVAKNYIGLALILESLGMNWKSVSILVLMVNLRSMRMRATTIITRRVNSLKSSLFGMKQTEP